MKSITLTSLLIWFVASVIGAPSSFAATATFTKLESIVWDEVCGVDTKGNTACVRSGGSPTTIPDSVHSLSYGFANQYFSCGIDAGTVKCWKDWTGTGNIERNPIPVAIRKFFKNTRPETVRTGTYNVCGVVAASGELHCLVPEWRKVTGGAIHIKPVVGITAIGLDGETFCWGDGNSTESKIACRSDSVGWQWPRDMKMKGLIEIIVLYDRMCARSKAEAFCWGPKGKTLLSTDLITAQSWNTAGDALCALTRDSRVACFDPVTGSILPTGLGHSIPTQYTTPSPTRKQLWTSASSACVLETSGLVNCWEWWNPSTNQIEFSRPVEQLFGNNYQPCARLDDGQVECRMYSYDSQTLKDTDRVRVAFGGWNKCFWNSSGIDCRSRVDKFSFRSVIDFAISGQGESVCAIGNPTNDPGNIPTILCSGYDPAMRAPPNELQNPVAIATTSEQACAVSDEGLTCWGTPYAEVQAPNTVVSASRLVMSDRHACILDQFGLACWGELNALDLQIPTGIDQPGRVIDVAVGTSRTCAVLDTGTVECWGRDFELSGPPPPLKGATSIVGRGGLFCALDSTGLHCWGGETQLPK